MVAFVDTVPWKCVLCCSEVGDSAVPGKLDSGGDSVVIGKVEVVSWGVVVGDDVVVVVLVVVEGVVVVVVEVVVVVVKKLLSKQVTFINGLLSEWDNCGQQIKYILNMFFFSWLKVIIFDYIFKTTKLVLEQHQQILVGKVNKVLYIISLPMSKGNLGKMKNNVIVVDFCIIPTLI